MENLATPGKRGRTTGVVRLCVACALLFGWLYVPFPYDFHNLQKTPNPRHTRRDARGHATTHTRIMRAQRPGENRKTAASCDTGQCARAVYNGPYRTKFGRFSVFTPKISGFSAKSARIRRIYRIFGRNPAKSAKIGAFRDFSDFRAKSAYRNITTRNRALLDEKTAKSPKPLYTGILGAPNSRN